MIERRPHLYRHCPLHAQEGCDWTQVTSWFVGGPHTIEAVTEEVLIAQAELHLSTHYVLPTQYFT